jgi:hypothetical protein
VTSLMEDADLPSAALAANGDDTMEDAAGDGADEE